MLRISSPAALRPARLTLGVSLILGLTLGGRAPAAEPLHERIDQLIAAGHPDFAHLAAPPASDAEFLRRVYLDLSGSIPTAAAARAFLDDHSANKRQQVIDRLLGSPEYARHMQQVFDVLLMERRRDQFVPRAAWQEYLRASFAADKPYDQLAREILSADGTDPRLRPAAKFFLDRQAEPHQLTRDIGRLFLGMNLQCAQCHDHPLVNSYLQSHYYGLYAFVSRTFVFRKGPAILAEKADGEVTFQSVFDATKLTKSTGPRVPDGPVVKEPHYLRGQEYAVAPASGGRPVPKFSRRAQLSLQVVSPANARFRRNIANRLWALMMGRGLVHPLDYDHPANPPSHPKLLTLLADEFATMKYEVRSFLRELAMTQTYQRSSELPRGVKDVPPECFAVANLKPLSPEQLAWGLMQATGLTEVTRHRLGKQLREETLYRALAGNVTPFAIRFGNRPGQAESGDFQATLEQTLFLTNGPVLRGWLAPQAGNLTFRLFALKDPAAVADEMYLSVLTRRPSAEESREVAAYLQGRTRDRTAALQEMAWALVASAEFRFNH
jgi:hypothetical protein